MTEKRFNIDAVDYDWIKKLSWGGPRRADHFVSAYGDQSEMVLERHKDVIPGDLREDVLKLLKDMKDKKKQ